MAFVADHQYNSNGRRAPGDAAISVEPQCIGAAMPGWLRTATQAFHRQIAEEPQAFELRCRCGHSVSGLRTRAPQRLSCPACQTPVFILPASVYPTPRVPQPKRLQPTTTESRPTAPAAVAAAPRVTWIESLEQWGAGGARDARRWLRRNLFRPTRIVGACMACVLATTGWWFAHTHATRRAETVLDAALERGRQSLEDGDFAAAAEQFDAVHRALDTLGRDDPASRGLVQLARETRAASQLSNLSLHDILAHAAKVAPTEWPAVFHARYKGAWVVFDAAVERSADPRAAPQYRIEFPIVVGPSRGECIADLDAFHQLADAPALRQVVFAAQLEDCRPDPVTPNVWRIVFQPHSGFLWANSKTYERLGFLPEERTNRVLSEQSQILGVRW